MEPITILFILMLIEATPFFLFFCLLIYVFIKIKIEEKRKLGKPQPYEFNWYEWANNGFNFPDNAPLYKASGLLQFRSDDLESVILQQRSEETQRDFLLRAEVFFRDKK